MQSISRRSFLHLTGIGAFASLLPSFLRPDIFTLGISQSWYLYIQSWKCNTRHDTDAQLHIAQQAGINTIVYNVHQYGAHYKSSFYTWCPDIEPGFDPLGYLTQRGGELGINIYAWTCPGGDVHDFKPEWNMAGKYGSPSTLHWLDFSNPDARERVKDIAVDLTSKYPVDICLDSIRYRDSSDWWPGLSPELSPQDITSTVALVKAAIAPRSLIADVRAHNYERCLQDWFTWLRTGIVDLVHPMAYAYKAGQIPSWVAKWDTNVPLDKVIPLLSLYDFNETPPSIKPSAEVLTEVNECKELGLADHGLAFFDSDGLAMNNIPLLRRLALEHRKLVHAIAN